MAYIVEIVQYDPIWPARFAQLGSELRAAMGTTALRIDHIGSTAIPGLAAKPIIDIQISVAAFEPLDAYRLPMERLGYVNRGVQIAAAERFSALLRSGFLATPVGWLFKRCA
jgi:GrpB-like predicted nucleotidyltransferase (UPF0157 family)